MENNITDCVVNSFVVAFVDNVKYLRRKTIISGEVQALKEVLAVFSARGPKGRTVIQILETVKVRCALRGLIRVDECLNFSSEIHKAILAFGIVSLKNVVLRSRVNWLKLSGVTEKMVDEIEASLVPYGLRLGMTEDDLKRLLEQPIEHFIILGNDEEAKKKKESELPTQKMLIMPNSGCVL